MTDAIPNLSLTESPTFRAGWLAVERGWNDAELATPEDFEGLAPTGPPIVAVMGAVDLTVHQARTLGAVAGVGRPILIVLSDGELEGAVQQWLGQSVEVVYLSHDDEAPVASTIEEETVPLPEHPPSGGQYCRIKWAGVNPSGGGSSAQASQYLSRLIDSLRLKGVKDGLCFAAQMPTSPAGISSWIEFSSADEGGRDYMVIETPIGAGRDPENLWTPNALSSFAWNVVRWCEQPLVQSGGKRKGWFRRSPEALTSPAPASACFPGGVRTVLRKLSTSDTLTAFRHEPSAIEEPVDLNSLTPLFFEYWIPLEEWSVFRSWAITAVTSLLRMLHLLQDPKWTDLPGRDPQTESEAVEQLKASLGFRAYGDLAERAFHDRHSRIRSIALADGSMTEVEFDALDLVEHPLASRPPLNGWPPRNA